MSSFAEQQTEWIINNILVNGGWIIDNKPEKNVYFQKARPEHQHLLESFSKKKGYKKPDYILYQEDKLAGIVEAKRGGEPLDKALKQATEYAEMLKAPLVFASNGAYVETYHLTKDKPLFINGEKVDRLIKYKEAVEFIKSDKNEIYTFPIEFIKSKEDLIRIFKKVNNLLRKANIFAGYDRISEFSSILFLKLISEQEGEKSYWNSIKKQDDDFLLSYLNGTVIKALEDKYNGGVFSEINLKKASVMRQIINIVDPLVLSDIKTDIKGDAFEYFLKNMNQADNDLGQYFTPRHIVKAMVHLIDPKFKETIYDPFCGTGGFLIEAFNHIKENSIIKTEKDRKILRENTLFGRDATKVSTIAKKNMILHGDGHSNIEEIDSLEHPIYKKMNVLITNIPFSLKDVDYTNLYHNGLGKKDGDAVCVLHCLDALEEGGRMAIIVPEGFLFRKQLAEVRKFLLSQANLELVVSLPQGVFLPYTGVKTDILYFTNAHKPKNQKGYYYFEIKKDGFTLDAHRRKIEGVNDIHKLEAINIRKGEKELLKEQGFEFIDFEKVRANGYNLIGSIYRKNIDKVNILPVKLREIAKIESGNSAPQEDSLFRNGIYKFFRVSDVAKEHLSTNLINTSDKLNSKGIKGLKLFPKNSILFPKSGASTLLNHRAIMGCDGYVASHLAVIQPDESKVLYKYLYYILARIDAKSISLNDGYPSIRIQDLQDVQIPLPSLPRQQEVVNELDSYQKIIDGIKQAIQNWKPYFDIDKNWELVKIGDIADINPKKNKIDLKKDALVSFLPMEEVGVSEISVLPKQERLLSEVNKGYTYFSENDLLIAKITPCFENGKMTIARHLKNGIGFGSTEFIVIRAHSKMVMIEWIYYCLRNLNFLLDGTKIMTGSVGHKRISTDFVRYYKIPLPSLDIQQEIAGRLEQECKMIGSQKEIIKLFEAKIQNRLNSLWQSEEENESVADKAIFDTLIKQASKPLES